VPGHSHRVADADADLAGRFPVGKPDLAGGLTVGVPDRARPRAVADRTRPLAVTDLVRPVGIADWVRPRAVGEPGRAGPFAVRMRAKPRRAVRRHAGGEPDRDSERTADTGAEPERRNAKPGPVAQPLASQLTGSNSVEDPASWR